MMNDQGPTDKEMLDWLEANADKDYGDGWICRGSTTGRGLRLHQTTDKGAQFVANKQTQPTVREAIIDVMKNGL